MRSPLLKHWKGAECFGEVFQNSELQAFVLIGSGYSMLEKKITDATKLFVPSKIRRDDPVQSRLFSFKKP